MPGILPSKSMPLTITITSIVIPDNKGREHTAPVVRGVWARTPKSVALESCALT